MLMLCAPSANRDPRRFEGPEVFDIHRAENRHLSFLHGIHYCVGAALARLELHVVFEQLLERYPDFSRGSAPAVRRSTNSTVRGFETLPVRL
jgi:cytochrome P450